MYYARPILRIYEKRALRPFMASAPSRILRNFYLSSATHRTNIPAPPEGDCCTMHYILIHSVKSHRFFPFNATKVAIITQISKLKYTTICTTICH